MEIVSWRAHARCLLRHRELAGVRPEPSSRLVDAHRRVYFTGIGLVDAPVIMLDAAAVGEPLVGPMIIESPVTTVVLDQLSTAKRLASGSLAIDPLAHERGKWLLDDELRTVA